MEVTLKGQNLLDIAIQGTGDPGDALAIAIANGLCLTDDLEAGQEVLIPDDIAGEVNVRAYYHSRGLRPATAINNDQPVLFEGIEYWGIEYDFEVS